MGSGYWVLGLCALLCYCYHRDMDGGNDLINVSSCIKHIASIFIINMDEVGLQMDRKYNFFRNEYDIVTNKNTSKSDSNACSGSRILFFAIGPIVFNVDRCVTDQILIENSTSRYITNIKWFTQIQVLTPSEEIRSRRRSIRKLCDAIIDTISIGSKTGSPHFSP